MRIAPTFNVALRALRRNTMRSVLTALGIIIGVSAVIAMVGIGNGAKAQVYGISVDTFFTLAAFKKDQNLNFPLLSDFNKEVIQAYGAFNPDMIGLKGIAKRAVFVLDKEGVVRHRQVLDDARNEPDYQKVYQALDGIGA